MVAPIERLTVPQFANLIIAARPTLTRRIVAVHLHHTWRPRRTDFRGRTTVEAMRRFHMVENGWSDIAQHLTIDPQGVLWTGRNWNAPPASQTGRNGTRLEGPFMIEMVGDFDRNAEILDGAQYDATLNVCAHLLSAFGLQTADIHFHRELGSPKTCPGSGVDKARLIADVEQAVTALPAAEPAAPGGTRSARAKRARAPFRADAVLGSSVAASWDGPTEDRTVPEGEVAGGAVARMSGAVVAGAGAVTREVDEWAMLRPHVINLTKGILSRSGSFKMLPGALEGIVDAIRDYALTTDAPKVMLHAHGGLVGERSALEYARTAVPWWKDQDIYPVYFVWETSAFEVIKQRLGIRGLGDVQDRAFEFIARRAAAWAWGDMKDSALLASSADADEGEAGGAFLFADPLAALVAAKPGGKDITLHAVGHSAGAIFHAHLLPLLVSKGLSIESLSVLAPAVRNDLFTSHLLPLATSSAIKRVLMCTMTEEAEREDDLIEPAGIPIYGKSLLYLISRAFEPKRKTPILGLDETLQDDAALLAFFNGGGGRLELSPAAGNPPNPNCTARRHGCFDNDTPTMRTVAGLVRDDGTQPAAPFPGDDCGERSRGRRRQIDPVAMAAASGRAGMPALASGPAPGGARRAVCVGIDRYTSSPLAGCVRDARNWGTALRSLGFSVTTLLDEQATRAGILSALTSLVTTASAGDVLVFQYAGHGTQVADVDGDDLDGFDEAFVPVDVDSGALLLDDDLAEVYARLPQGAVLTLFMDCCHSGTNSRFAPRAAATATGRERRRYLPLSPWLEQAHRLFRSRMAPASRAANAATASLDGIVHVAACQDNQYAYELDGAGNFTRIAAAALVDAVGRGETNEAFVSRIASAVEALGNPQTPGLMKLPAVLTNIPLLSGAAAGSRPAPADASGAAAAGGDGALVHHLTEALRLAGGRP